MGKKVLVMGLDCAAPQLLYKDLFNMLPNLGKLIQGGIYGELASSHPPITIPAWMVMVTGADPGSLGLYGFRHRKGFSYDKGWIANSKSIKKKTVWDYAGEAGKRVSLVGVPPSYPPRPVNGNMVSCFITPGIDRPYTYPGELQEEIEGLIGEYMFDVVFRTEDRDVILDDLYTMTEKRFKVIEHLMAEKPWDFFMFVEIGVDRVHHAFWKYYDREHPKYEPGNKYENVIPDYYRYIDQKIGRLLEIIDKDTVVLVVSDHGAKGMRGCFCINQWLMEQGYLVLKERPDGIVSLDRVAVDWSKTKAWGWGGYYARIFFNVKGRELAGIIPFEEYEKEREMLIDKLMQIKDPAGRLMENKIFKPEELYSECKGDPPDLMVYFDALFWRSAGTIGHGSLYLAENDTGPDDAVHDYNGIYIYYDPRVKYGMKVEGAGLLDIAPTILHLMGLLVPEGMSGRILLPEYQAKENGLCFVREEKCLPRETQAQNVHQAAFPADSAGKITIRSNLTRNEASPVGARQPGDGCVIWLTGLSGAGKSTLAGALAARLKEKGRRVEVLDGDEVRAALSPDLGFSKEEREMHNRRIIYLAKLLSRNGVVVIIPVISPYRVVRELAREELPCFVEVWVKCSLTECIRRDPKGLYKKALAGEIDDLTGLQDPYEEPLSPEIIVDTEKQTVEEGIEQILKLLHF